GVQGSDGGEQADREELHRSGVDHHREDRRPPPVESGLGDQDPEGEPERDQAQPHGRGIGESLADLCASGGGGRHAAQSSQPACARRTLLRPGPPGIREVIEYSVDEAVEGARRPPHRGLPSTTLTVVFATSGPLLCSADHESWAGRRGTTHDVCVGAFHTQPVYLQRPDHQDGVQVGLHPLAARRVLGLPAAALTDLTQEGEAVAGSSMRTLWSRAGSAAPGERARLIADGLASVADRHDRAPAPRREVLGAWNLLARARGTMTITDVAFRVGLSSRHLSSLVRAE